MFVPYFFDLTLSPPNPTPSLSIEFICCVLLLYCAVLGLLVSAETGVVNRGLFFGVILLLTIQPIALWSVILNN